MALLKDDEIEEQLERVPKWQREGDAIQREFKFEDFQASVDFVNRLAPPAEEMNHHPDITISWNVVELTLSTHSQGGLTAADFDLAKQIDSLV